MGVLLGFGSHHETPLDPLVERTWESEGVRGEEVSWSVGYGPRTHAWLLKPTSPTATELPGWEYPLLRWWQVGLARGWAAPVEYYSPPYGRGALLQAWSSFPAAVALRWRDRVVDGSKRWEGRAEGGPRAPEGPARHS